jgi:transposase
MSIPAIRELTEWDRKTIRKYMQAAEVVPEYGPRQAQPSKLDAFKSHLEERRRAGVVIDEVGYLPLDGPTAQGASDFPQKRRKRATDFP